MMNSRRIKSNNPWKVITIFKAFVKTGVAFLKRNIG